MSIDSNLEVQDWALRVKVLKKAVIGQLSRLVRGDAS